MVPAMRRLMISRPLVVAVIGVLAGAVPPGSSSLRAAGAELIASAEPGWPQFRGPRRDGLSDERNLLGAWPEGGPRLLWSARGLGKGFSSVAITGGKIFTMGARKGGQFILALDVAKIGRAHV